MSLFGLRRSEMDAVFMLGGSLRLCCITVNILWKSGAKMDQKCL